jgi:hypothetical protein
MLNDFRVMVFAITLQYAFVPGSRADTWTNINVKQFRIWCMENRITNKQKKQQQQKKKNQIFISRLDIY